MTFIHTAKAALGISINLIVEGSLKAGHQCHLEFYCGTFMEISLEIGKKFLMLENLFWFVTHLAYNDWPFGTVFQTLSHGCQVIQILWSHDLWTRLRWRYVGSEGDCSQDDSSVVFHANHFYPYLIGSLYSLLHIFLLMDWFATM